jgi:predicted nucleic acid-binding protein
VSASAPVVLDTNIASQRFKKRPQVSLARLIGATPIITFVTCGELRKWARMRDWAPNSAAGLQDWLDHVYSVQDRTPGQNSAPGSG